MKWKFILLGIVIYFFVSFIIFRIFPIVLIIHLGTGLITGFLTSLFSKVKNVREGALTGLTVGALGGFLIGAQLINLVAINPIYFLVFLSTPILGGISGLVGGILAKQFIKIK